MVVHGDGLFYAQPIDALTGRASIAIACAKLYKRFARSFESRHVYNDASTRSLRLLLTWLRSSK